MLTRLVKCKGRKRKTYAPNQNKCESPTGDMLVPAKKDQKMFVKTIHVHDRITLCGHAHFQAHRVILSQPCIVMMGNPTLPNMGGPNRELKKYDLVSHFVTYISGTRDTSASKK